MRRMTKVELGWLAGIVEGEGTAGVWARGKTPTSRRYPMLVVQMVDRDVIERLAQITGVGTVSLQRRRDPRHQDQWRWRVARWDELRPLLLLLRPLVGQRRGAKIDEIFQYERDHPRRGPGRHGERWGARAKEDMLT